MTPIPNVLESHHQLGLLVLFASRMKTVCTLNVKTDYVQLPDRPVKRMLQELFALVMVNVRAWTPQVMPYRTVRSLTLNALLPAHAKLVMVALIARSIVLLWKRDQI